MPKPPKIPPLANLRSTAKPLATHFTPTVPYAESKLPPMGRSSSTTVVDFRNPKSSETPRERVARLREAARRARMQGLPWQDRMIETGRVYMDYAHRGFVMFLIGVAALGGIGLVYSTIDIIRFTRAKSRIFREETGTKRAAVLHDALSAAATGKATLRQKLFLERYERVKQAEEERLRQRGPFKSVIDYMFPGVMSAATEATILAQLDDVLYVEMEKVAETPGLLDQPAPDARIPDGLAGEMAGGPLDLTAQGAVDAAEKSTKSWASWLGWR